MSELNIGGRKVGSSYSPLVIAEIGINHGGSIVEAKKIVDAAANAGVEVVKHQTHVPEDEMSMAADKVIPGNSTDSIYKIVSKCALSRDDEQELMDYVTHKGMIFISTPFSRAAADRLAEMDIPAFKIGSGECNNYPLVKHIAGFGKPVILSTGMNTIASISKSVAILENFQVPYALLHTTNLYPTPHELVRLGAMVELGNEFKNAVIGLSDHTVDNYACIAAVALGASILERHFTDSMDRTGPDIQNSMDPKACEELIKATNIVFKERGGKKGIIPEEKVTMDFAFATVVAIRDIEKGEIFSLENIWVKRPGVGEFAAEKLEELLGKVASEKIMSDTHIRKIDVVN